MRMTLSVISSPIGPLTFAVDEAGILRASGFGVRPGTSFKRPPADFEFGTGSLPPKIAKAVHAYFSGDIASLAGVPWSLDGAADTESFEMLVWRALADVPAGSTLTYGQIARLAGDPGAAREAGVALNRNPLPLVLPCHRVIGADGGLVGFGGGLDRKAWLLRHEGALLL